jgi:hypothetical protein
VDQEYRAQPPERSTGFQLAEDHEFRLQEFLVKSMLDQARPDHEFLLHVMLE